MDSKAIQQALIRAGYDVGKAGADGILGKDSRNAVEAFQVARKIIGDVGPLTEAALSAINDNEDPAVSLPKEWVFAGPAIRMADQDLPRIGSQIGVGEDEVHAFLDAETRGSGFDASFRPKMLFEPHRFYANLSGTQRDQAVAKGLAYKNWKKDYPKDSYPRLIAAMKINETAALKSASWGLGQIMGENFISAGYDSPQEMVQSFIDKGEAEHLQAAVNFIKYNHLDDELRNHDWAAFARGYNGPGYAKNGYHITLANRYAYWRTKPDTPWVRLAEAA